MQKKNKLPTNETKRVETFHKKKCSLIQSSKTKYQISLTLFFTPKFVNLSAQLLPSQKNMTHSKIYSITNMYTFTPSIFKNPRNNMKQKV